MDAFIIKHRSFLLSFLYMLAGLALFGYSVFYSPREVAIADLRRLADILQKESAPLQAEQARRQGTAPSASDGIQSLPTFLEHINGVARETAVIIKELMPARDGELKFNLKIEAPYGTFLNFAAKLESLNVSINDLQVHPYNPSARPPVHAIEFSLTPRDDAAPLASQRIADLARQVTEPNRRNPFQRFAFNATTKQVIEEIDLTWIYRLSGIGMVGNRKVATIDIKEQGIRDYGVGDEVAPGLTIVAIEADYVRLERKPEKGQYVLRYRRSRLDRAPTAKN